MFSKFYIMILFYVLTFISSLTFTFFVRKLALKKNIIDNPNERSSHTIPTPRGGGLAIIITWFTSLTILYLFNLIDQRLFFALLSGLILAIISFLDDIIDLPPLIRLFAQSISGIGALYFLNGFQFEIIPNNPYFFWLENFVTLIGIIWFINLFNFLDGIDAYASLEGIFVAIGIFLIIHNPILIILITCIGGFLFWNWPKAKIFMGDVGSTQIGFILIIFGIYFSNLNELTIIDWLILTSLFWFDATVTLLRRIFNKENISQPHRKHAYQRLTQAGISHLTVNIWGISINILLILLTALNHYIFNIGYYLLVIVLLFLSFIYILIEKIFPFNQREN